MTKFMFKCFGITALLLFGVLFGIQKAHFEMNELKGASNKESIESMNDSFSSEDKGVEKTSSHDIKTKQETLNKIDSFNVFSAFGQKLTTWISSAFSVMISVLGIIIQEMLDVFSP
jgi:Protein of unknown function (DUF3679)